MSFANAGEGKRAPQRLYVANADGSRRRLLTPTVRDAANPAWSPDGRQLVFVCGGNQISDICVMGSDGRGRRRLTEDAAEARLPDWQPLPG